MNRLMILLLVATTIAISSCAKIYYSPDAQSLSSKHQVIAIAPPKVSIAASKKVDAETPLELQSQIVGKCRQHSC